jgi:hypothetical protein
LFHLPFVFVIAYETSLPTTNDNCQMEMANEKQAILGLVFGIEVDSVEGKPV